MAKRLALGPVRERLLQFLVENPGSTIQQVAKVIECSHSTATFYLNSLVRSRLVTRQRDGRSLQHYVSGKQDMTSLLQPFLRDERARSVCLCLVASHGKNLSVNQISRQLGLNYGFVLRTMRRLVPPGFVLLSRPRARYMVCAAEKLLQAAKELSWTAPEPVPAVETVA